MQKFRVVVPMLALRRVAAVAVMTLAAAVACVAMDTSSMCLDEYLCSFEVADSTGATYSFDFRQLCVIGTALRDTQLALGPPVMGTSAGRAPLCTMRL